MRSFILSQCCDFSRDECGSNFGDMVTMLSGALQFAYIGFGKIIIKGIAVVLSELLKWRLWRRFHYRDQYVGDLGHECENSVFSKIRRCDLENIERSKLWIWHYFYWNRVIMMYGIKLAWDFPLFRCRCNPIIRNSALDRLREERLDGIHAAWY